jgi:hypothetical protein
MPLVHESLSLQRVEAATNCRHQRRTHENDLGVEQQHRLAAIGCITNPTTTPMFNRVALACSTFPDNAVRRGANTPRYRERVPGAAGAVELKPSSGRHGQKRERLRLSSRVT